MDLMLIAKEFGPWVALSGLLIWWAIRNTMELRKDFRALGAKCDKNEIFIREELADMNRKLVGCLAKNSEALNRNTESYDRTNELLERIGSYLGETHETVRHGSSERKQQGEGPL